MATAAEVLGDLGNIELSFAANAEAELACDLAEKDSRFNSGDADEIVDDAFAVFGHSADTIHIFAGDPGPGEVAITLEVGESNTKQADLAGRVGEVDVTGDLAGVGPVGGKIVDESERVRGGAGIREGAGVGEDGGVKSSGHGGCDVDFGGDSDAVDHSGDGAGVFIDPVNGGEGAAAGVVVDVDEGAAFETEESGAVDAITFEQDGGCVAVGVDVIRGCGVVDAIQIWEGAVGGGNGSARTMST